MDELPKPEPLPELKTLSAIDVMMMPQHRRDAMSLRCEIVHRIDSHASLRAHLAECIRWWSLNNRPVTLQYLNRVYGRVAHRYGTSARLEVLRLLESGHVGVLERGNKRGYVDSARWLEVTQASPDAIGEIVQAWCSDMR